MEGGQLTPESINLLLGLLQNLQVGLLWLLHAVGMAGEAHGQAAWPFDVRISADMIRFDPGHARRVALSLLALAVTLILLLVALAWRKRRLLLLGVALVLLVVTPWPAPTLLFAPAYATSFNRSTSGFTPASIARGRTVYQQHCVACHGDDARGEGPLAASLPRWPPTLNGSLLWQRLDGELFWRILAGMRDRHGQQTMPGFSGQISDGEVWAVIDFLQANAAGQSLKRTGVWENPIHAPDLQFDCAGAPRRPLAALQGVRVRLAALGEGAQAPREDPRLMSIALTGNGSARDGARADCVVTAQEGWNALALIAGVSPNEMAGHQFIVDRDGWLRAHIGPGQGWSDDALVCRARGGEGSQSAPMAAVDNLERLIERMDRERISLLRGGFPH